MDLLYGQDLLVAEWVNRRTPDLRGHWEHYKAIGVLENRSLIAGVVYHDYHFRDMQLSMASESPKWCSRITLRALLGYPFIQLKVERITICTGKKNKKMRKLAEGLGFKLEGRLRKGYPDDDCLIYGLLKEEAEQWIRLKT